MAAESTSDGAEGERDRTANSIAGWGIAMGLGWAGLAVLMAVPSIWAAPGLPLGFSSKGFMTPTPAEWDAARPVFLVLVGLLWAAYWFAARRARVQASGGGFGLILVGALVFGALTLPWGGLLSSDVYGYAAQGKMQLVYGLNPLVVPPNAMTGDPLAQMTIWGNITTTYGPAWLVVTRLVAMVAPALGGEPVGYLVTFKLISLGLVALSVWLLWRITGQLGWAAGRRAEATLLFAWCPLVLLELVGNAHNDSLLVVLLLAAVWLHLRGNWPLAVGALMLCGLVKLTGFFCLPAYLVLLARGSADGRQAARRLAASIAICLAVGIAAYLPYSDPRLPSALLKNPVAGFAASSLLAAARQQLVNLQVNLSNGMAPRQALENVRWVAWYAPQIVWAVVALALSLRVRDFGGMIRAWGLVIFFYLLFAASWFEPWYTIWLLPIMALLPPSRLRLALLLLAIGSTLYYVVFPQPDTPRPDLATYYVPAAIFLPTLCYCTSCLAGDLIAKLRQRGPGRQPIPILKDS